MAAAPVRWLKIALRNLDEELTHIASDDPKSARAVLHRIADAISLLSTQPSLGRPGRVPGTRELIVPKTRYLIPYRLRRGTIEILRIFHASRRPPRRC
jgi:toxin ParE1/3/4